jgi:hypothetical protein
MAKRQNGCDPGYGVLHVFPACHEMPWLLRQGFILETHSLRNLWIHTYTSYSRVGLERRMTCHVVLWWDEQRSPCATSAEAAAPQRMSGVSKTPREDNIPRKTSPTSANTLVTSCILPPTESQVGCDVRPGTVASGLTLEFHSDAVVALARV